MELEAEYTEDRPSILQILANKNPSKIFRKKNANFDKLKQIYDSAQKQLETFSNGLMITYNMYCDHSEAVVDRFGGKSKRETLNFDCTIKLAQSLGYACELGGLVGLIQFVKKTANHYSQVYKAMRLTVIKEVSIKGFVKEFEEKTDLMLENVRSNIRNIFADEDSFLKASLDDLVFEILTSLVSITLYD